MCFGTFFTTPTHMKPIFELVFEIATITTILMIVLYIFKARYFERKEEKQISLREDEESLTRKYLTETLQGYFCFTVIFLTSLFLFLENFEDVFFQGYFDFKTALLLASFVIVFFSIIGVFITVLILVFSTFASIIENLEEFQDNISE